MNPEIETHSDTDDEVAQLLAHLESVEPRELWASLREKLQDPGDGFPYEAIGFSLLAQDRLAPLWLEDLQAFAADHSLISETGTTLHLHLITLLAIRHDPQAFQPMLALSRLDEAECEELLGDFASAVMGRALAAVAEGQIPALLELAGDAKVSIWLRSGALEALAVRAMEGEEDRAEMARLLMQTGEQEAARLLSGQDGSAELLSMLVGYLCDVCCTEADALITQWCADDLLDESFAGDLDAIRSELQRDFTEVSTEMRDNGLLYITDAAAELDNWAVFSEEEGADSMAQLVNRAEPKTGRNDPCPCGSGKKFKKCCGA